jgi:molybdenum cofactor biosynthesis protein B
MSRIDESLPFKPVRIAILTVSDTRTPKDDKSGALLAEMLQADGHELAARAIVRDDVEQIRAQLRAWIADPAVDAAITTGGTGLTGRDVTPEAVRPLFEKEIDGFSVLMHMLSYGKIGTSTIQSRALAGVAGGTYIFCLPGSPGACKDAWTMILRLQFDFRHRPCNFVEIMPRLMEHIEPQR